MKKVLVTGGTGFIGSHVVDHLIKNGFKVYVLDRVFKPPLSSKYTTILGDIKNRHTVFEVVSSMDGVINLAGILGTAETVDNPYPSVETNILGALNFLEACRVHKKKGVQIAVGNHFMNNTYAISKTTAERFALMYNKEHDTQIAVVRALNAYGPRQKHKPVRKVTPNFILRALRGEHIKIFGSGNSIMDMIYIKDVAKILVKALVLDHGCYHSIFEAGVGRRVTVNQIAELVNRLTGNKAGVEHVPMRAGEDEDAVVLGDPTTLAPLGITPDDLTVLEQGMKITVDWYKKNYPWKED